MLSILVDNVYFLDIFKKLQKEFGLKVSEATVKRARKKLGWIKSGPKYCQLVKEKNRIARLNFCLEASRTNDNFANVIFTDECSVWMETHTKICFRRIGELPKQKPKVKHPYKIHACLGRDQYTRCKRHSFVYRNHEERILCRIVKLKSRIEKF